MVENQHGLGSVLSFSAKSVNPKILEALLIGREKIVNQLENRVKNISNDGLNHQVLIIGARGTGKTHMLSVLHNRIQPQIKKKKIKVAYFAEEEYGISDYLDFMVRILNAFIRWNEKDAEYLKNQLSILQETPNSQQEDTIKRIIREYIDDRPLLILAENFNDILSAIKKDGQSKLRNWLQENNRISIIATSQALSDDVGKEDKPFFGFFDEINIKPLSLEQSFKLLKSLAKLEKRKDIIEHLENKGKSQVMAINTLVKGNHRLLITFYEFLKSDVLSNLSVMFIKTLNDLKPYYETFIRYQPPQQQKIIRYLALSKTPRKGTEIARECFIEQKSLSKQMSELAKKKLVDVITDPDDKRNKLYDISEPLLRISIEIGEHKEGISALFIDFLALYYSQNELNNQKEKFNKIYQDCIDPKEKQQYSFEISARDRALKIQEKSVLSTYNSFLSCVKSKDYEKALSIIDSISNENRDDIFNYLKASLFYLKGDNLLAKKYALLAFEFNSIEETNLILLANIYYDLKEYENAITFYGKTIELNPKNEEALLGLSEVFKERNEVEKQIETLKEIIKINNENKYAHKNIGVTYFTQEEYKKAIPFLKTAIELNPNNQHTFDYLGMSYGYLKQYNKAINLLKKALKIDPTKITTLKILIVSYIKIRDFKNATNLLYRVLDIKASKIKKSDVSWAINTILKYDYDITTKKCLEIEWIIKENFNKAKDLNISLQLIKTFRKVVLENDKKALYDLPKEQREFFQKEILDFREQNLS